MGEGAFRVFGVDRNLYGPVATTTLLEWVNDGRVQRNSWIHTAGPDVWQRAADLPELSPAFAPTVSAQPSASSTVEPVNSRAGVPVKVLGRLRVFSEMSPAEQEPFARVLVEESFRPFTYIVRQGDHGDAMYFVIQGRVGVSTKGQVTESFLVGLGIGDTFGEMSLFDPGPRSADVRAETDVVVLKLTVDALENVCREAPVSANRFLWNVARLLSARMRSIDKRASSARDLDAVGREVDAS